MELPGTLIFDYPTVAALTAYISAQHSAAQPAAEPASAAAALMPTSLSPGRLVQGMRRDPGDVVVVDKFSGRFAEQTDGGMRCHDSCRVTPFQRWDVDANAPHVSHRPGARFGRYAKPELEPHHCCLMTAWSQLVDYKPTPV